MIIIQIGRRGVAPDIAPNARVIKCRVVSGVDAIEVVGGKYRAALVNGVFELVNPPASLPGRVKVRCSWFEVTPPTTCPNIDISDAKVKRYPGYTGKVADNIGKVDIDSEEKYCGLNRWNQ